MKDSEGDGGRIIARFELHQISVNVISEYLWNIVNPLDAEFISGCDILTEEGKWGKRRVEITPAKCTYCNLELPGRKASNKQSASPLVLPLHITTIPLGVGNNYMQFFYFSVGRHDTMFFLLNVSPDLFHFCL